MIVVKLYRFVVVYLLKLESSEEAKYVVIFCIFIVVVRMQGIQNIKFARSINECPKGQRAEM